MSVEILNFDSALLPTEQSFFSDDCPQSQSHYSEITPQLDSYDFEEFEYDLRSICDIEFALNNEPELSLEAMTKEDDIQCQTKANELFDYLDSSVFLSPLSTEPSSPQSVYANDSGVDTTTALSLLEEILTANSSDSEYPSDECLDSELNIQSITEISKDSNTDEILPPETKSSPKRQYKRKAHEKQTNEKPNKKSKITTTEKKERKRNQNKSAANRYRQKKRMELDDIEEQQNVFVQTNNGLKDELQKLQMEFNILHRLAKDAFASNPKKAILLNELDIRVQKHNLLD